MVALRVAGPSGSRILDASLDSGSDDTLLPAYLAGRLGIDVAGAPEREARAIGGVPVLYRYARLLLRRHRELSVDFWDQGRFSDPDTLSRVDWRNAASHWAAFAIDHAGTLIVNSLTLLAALLVGQVSCGPPVSAAEFMGWFDAALRGELAIPAPVVDRAAGFRYVFVGGLRTSRMPAYFAQNAHELCDFGVPRRFIHIVHPTARFTIEENSDAIRDEFMQIACQGPERLVVIAHSTGGCAALDFALRNPQFVRDRVEAIFLIQTPIGGTGLADYVVGEGHPMDEQMPPGARQAARMLGALERSRMRRGPHAGIPALTRTASRAYWDRMLREHADAVPVVGPRLFYIESVAHPDDLSMLARATGWYLAAYYGPNDGIVCAGDQNLPGLGTRLGVLNAGHSDLTRRFPAARAGRQFRRALVQSILMVIGKSEPALTTSRAMGVKP
jgi:pimeloyl-ACP methyl ester carboxylesterase